MTRIRGGTAHKLRQEFFEEGKRLDADPTTRDLAACWLCGDRIDYIADPGTTGHSHHLDHYYPVSEYPELQLDPTGFRHSHADCNMRRKTRAPLPGLGKPMPKWW